MRERRAHVALTLLAVAVTAALATALLGVTFAIRERMARELRAFGANILIVPRSAPLAVTVGSLRYVPSQEEAYLEESELARLKTIFWRHNIVAFAPFLSRTVEVAGQRALLVGTWFDKRVDVPVPSRRFSFASGASREVAAVEGGWNTGLEALVPSWQVDGRWVREGSGGALVGRALAARLAIEPGQTLEVELEGRRARFPVHGLLRTGGVEEDQIFVELAAAQALFGRPGRVEKVQVSALVTPDNALAVRARTVGPESLPPSEYETWYCTPYLDSIVFQIEEALTGARGTAIRQVAEAEQAFLGKVTGVFVLSSALGLATAGLGVAATTARAIFERRAEVGLMKALGGDRRQIARLLLVEAGVTGLGGGIVGALLGVALTRVIGLWVFATPIESHVLLLLAILGVAPGVALLGALGPLRAALAVPAATTLSAE